MELAFSNEQILLQDTVRQLCHDMFPLNALRKVEASVDGFPSAFWRALCEMGVPGISIPAEHGGLGMGLLETALVYEELGRQLVPTPHFTSCVLSAGILANSGTTSQCKAWLPGIVSGTSILTMGVMEPGSGFDVRKVATSFTQTAGKIAIHGNKHFVPFASISDYIIVLGRHAQSGKIGAAVVPRDSQGMHVIKQANLASEPYFSIEFDNVRIPPDHLLVGHSAIEELWEGTMQRGLVLLAAQAVGAARNVHAISTEYAKQREAFGRPIGGFQAIAHYLADAIVEIEGCATLVHQAAWLHDNDRPFAAIAAMAKLQCCSMFRRVSAIGIQVHGGLGYTTEADPQLFFRRAKQWQLLNWDETFLEDIIAHLTLDTVGPDV